MVWKRRGGHTYRLKPVKAVWQLTHMPTKQTHAHTLTFDTSILCLFVIVLRVNFYSTYQFCFVCVCFCLLSCIAAVGFTTTPAIMTIAFFIILLLNCMVIFAVDALLPAPAATVNTTVIVVNGTTVPSSLSDVQLLALTSGSGSNRTELLAAYHAADSGNRYGESHRPVVARKGVIADAGPTDEDIRIASTGMEVVGGGAASGPEFYKILYLFCGTRYTILFLCFVEYFWVFLYFFQYSLYNLYQLPHLLQTFIIG